MAKWLVPTLGYVLVLGALGVTSKLALRTIPWQGLILVTTLGYVLTSALFAGLGQVQLSWNVDLFWTVVSAALAISALVMLYIALEAGEASKVVPVTAAYPAITLVGAAIFLSEALTVGRVAGALLVIVGVVILTSAK